MRSVIPMRTAKVGYVILSVAMCLLGILLMAMPGFSMAAVGLICGVLLIVFGVVRLVGYFSKDLYRLAFQYDLALGIMMIILGAVMLWRPGSLIHFICISLGLLFLADGLFKIQIALDSRRFGIREWWLILVLALITVIFGAALTLRPGESSRILTMLIGMNLLSEGILNIGTVITAVKIIRHQQPDMPREP